MGDPPARTRPALVGSWAPGPAKPQLAQGDVHVWRIPLAHSPLRFAGELSPDERRRAAAFVRRADGDRWATSRVALRDLLGRYLSRAPSDIAFERGRGGKPRIAGSDLQYNLTHSFDLALCAVGRMDLGVDVEKLRAAPMAAGIAAGIVSPDGPIRPDEAGSAELDWVFFQAWTRVEATLKATGEGLSAIDRRSPAWIRDLAFGTATQIDGRPLLLVDLPVDAGYSAAIAVLGTPAIESMSCWSWAR